MPLKTAYDRMRDFLARQGLLEMTLLVALLGMVGSVWAFAEIADEVMESDSKHFDVTILRAFRTPGDLGTGIGPKWLPAAVGDLTALGARRC